jgi:four helix bundle protein
MSAKHNFRKLKIWEIGMEIVKESYSISKNFPEFERYILTSQLLRCAISIPSNIAEGTSKSTDKHLFKYLDDALGSSFEWETQIIIAFNSNYIDSIKYFELIEKIQHLQKMISNFKNKLID